VKKIKLFLARKDIEFSLKRYGVDAMSAMALGLFSSLIVGLILREVGSKLGIPLLAETLGPKAMAMVGSAIGAAVAFGLKAPPLVLFSSVITGFVGNEAGGPAGAFVAAVLGAEFGKAISKETKVDIIITPVVTIAAGVSVGIFIGPAISEFMASIGRLIIFATNLLPVPMGILVSVIMGIVLTLPISSAALGIMLGLSGIAAGAACAGCCANMVGFAVAGYRDNKVSGLISQGIGTSMLQMPNIIKKPIIWIPAIAASAVTGPVSTAVFKMENIPAGSGMGTSGLVGQFGTLAAMGYTPQIFIQILTVHFVLPAIISLAVSEWMRKRNWIKEGDMKLP